NVVVGLNTSSRCCQPRFLHQLCKPHGGAGDVSAFVDPFIPASRSVKARGQDEVPTNSLHINIRQQAIPAAKCPFEVVMKPALTSGADSERFRYFVPASFEGCTCTGPVFIQYDETFRHG